MSKVIEATAKDVTPVTQLKVSTDFVYGQILEWIENPPKSSVVLRITPSCANNILTRHNEGNRPMKPQGVRDYVSDMEKGEWGVTGDTIKFSKEGRLLDGQNRMMACVQAGVPFDTHVVFGIDDELFKRIDVGRPRTPGDILHIAGHKDVNRLASAVRHTLVFEGRLQQLRGKHVRPEVILRALEDDYPELEDYMLHGRTLYNTFRYPPGEAAALLRKMFQVDPAAADKFYEAWRYGYMDGRNEVVAKMKEYLESLRVKIRGGIPARTRITVVVTAWNAFRQNKRGNMKMFDNALATHVGETPAFDGDLREHAQHKMELPTPEKTS